MNYGASSRTGRPRFSFSETSCPLREFSFFCGSISISFYLILILFATKRNREVSGSVGRRWFEPFFSNVENCFFFPLGEKWSDGWHQIRVLSTLVSVRVGHFSRRPSIHLEPMICPVLLSSMSMSTHLQCRCSPTGRPFFSRAPCPSDDRHCRPQIGLNVPWIFDPYWAVSPNFRFSVLLFMKKLSDKSSSLEAFPRMALYSKF